MSLADYAPPREEQPIPKSPPEGGLQMKQDPHILANIQQRDPHNAVRAPHPMEGLEETEYGRDFNAALRASPSMQRYWVEPPQAPVENSIGNAIWESVKRDSFIGNVVRWMDQTLQEFDRTPATENEIWQHREELTHGIPDHLYADVLNAPTMGAAMEMANLIRHREEQIKREHNQSIGKTLVADIAGFIVDPSNLLPGYGMMKGVQVASRVRSVSALAKFSQSSKMTQMGTLAAAGAFEEAIRMAPRYASDPTFEANNYMEGIAMSAAFSGLLPAAFTGARALGRRGIEIAPKYANDINAHLHAWGVDVGVRQAMRFPGKFKETGFKDPGTALRKSKEAAQDAVDRKVKEVNAHTNTKQFNESLKQDMGGETPNNAKTMSWMEDQIDRAGDAALGRVKRKLQRAGVATGAAMTAATIGGPVAGIATAALFANKDYLAIAARHVSKQRQLRRSAYDAAISAGDTAKAQQILRDIKATKGKTTVAKAVEGIEDQITNAVDAAKVKLRAINEKAKVC